MLEPAQDSNAAGAHGSGVSEATYVVFGAFVFGFLFSYPLLRHIGAITQVFDWQRGLEWSWANWITIDKFHQVPLWNPYKCGGIPSLANPQSHWLTPLIILHLAFGPVAGLELEIPFHLSIAFAGAYVLARVVGCAPVGAFVSGLAFAGSSWLPLHIAAGHDVFLPGAYIPWSCALAWESFIKRRPSYAALAGLFIALTFTEGGVYCVVQSAILLVLICSIAAATERSMWPLAALGLVGVFAAGLGAIKLLPAIHLMAQRPRTGYVDWVGPYETLLSIFSRSQDLFGPGGQRGFWEHGAYVSPALAVLALLGAIMTLRRALPWVVGTAVIFVLAMGGTSPYAPYVLLHRLPWISSTYLPSRYVIPLVLCIAVLSGLGADYLMRWGPKARTVVFALLAIGFVDLLIVSPLSLNQAFDSGLVLPALPYSTDFRQYRGAAPRTNMLGLNLKNLGSPDCFETQFINYSRNPVLGYNQSGYRGEQYLLDAGSARLDKWTPNELSYDVDAQVATTMVINQNYDEGWRLVEGRGVIFSMGNLIALHLAEGKQRLRLAYRSTPFEVGLVITILSFAGMLALLRRETAA